MEGEAFAKDTKLSTNKDITSLEAFPLQIED